jgi:predicted 3-demethylubiquinone-9 3-methyltransferase (glyoxalase superfamily)
MPKPYPCLWFESQAAEAAKFYASIFPRSKVGTITKVPESVAKHSGQRKGSVLTAEFTLDGQRFFGLNGGPGFPFTQAISLVVPCKDQKEVDFYWERLSKGGEKSVCGWLKDKYGLSWQIVPEALWRMFAKADAKTMDRLMAAVMKMTKLDLAALKKAFAGK